MKCSNSEFAEKFKNSIMITLEMRLLGLANKFKTIYSSKNKSSIGEEI